MSPFRVGLLAHPSFVLVRWWWIFWGRRYVTGRRSEQDRRTADRRTVARRRRAIEAGLGVGTKTPKICLKGDDFTFHLSVCFITFGEILGKISDYTGCSEYDPHLHLFCSSKLKNIHVPRNIQKRLMGLSHLPTRCLRVNVYVGMYIYIYLNK